MNVTGSSLDEVLSRPREQLMAERQIIGAWNRERDPDTGGTNTGGGLPPGAGP